MVFTNIYQQQNIILMYRSLIVLLTAVVCSVKQAVLYNINKMVCVLKGVAYLLYKSCLLFWGSVLEELLNDVIAEHVGHQWVCGRKNFLKKIFEILKI